jgi:predicted ester cyclase
MADTEANKQLVRDFIEVVKSRRQLDRIGEFFHKDYTEHNTTVAGFGRPGIDAYQNFLTHFWTGYPDTKVETQLLLAECDLVATYNIEGGTNTGEFLGVPATGKQASYPEIHFFRIAHDKIAEHWVQPDVFGWFTQIGAINLGS